MGMGENCVVVKHVGKEVIVSSEKQMNSWVYMAKHYSENVMVKSQLQCW
jgi:hypothetical protein